jgi:hypothetical protein
MWCADDNRGLDQCHSHYEAQRELPKEKNIFYKATKKLIIFFFSGFAMIFFLKIN